MLGSDARLVWRRGHGFDRQNRYVGQEWDRVVYISSRDDHPFERPVIADLSRWVGHVESYKHDHYEEAQPDGGWWDSVDDAIAWGRSRAPIVLVRIANTHYSAGSVHAEDDEDEQLPLWPPETPPTPRARE